MPSLNKVLLMGNLTRDPELRVTPKGTAVCEFSIAINRSYKTESGETREEVTYVDIISWQKQAETIAKYLTKGKPIYVEGSLKLDTWEDKNTKEKRSRMKVLLQSFQFIGTKDSSGAAPSEGEQTERKTFMKPAQKQAAPQSENLDEDVPF